MNEPLDEEAPMTGEGVLTLPQTQSLRTEDIRRGRRGVEEVVTDLYTKLRAPLVSYVYHLVSSTRDAEDLVQIAFLQLFDQLEHDGEIENVRGWLYRVVHNLAIEHARQHDRRGSLRRLGNQFSAGQLRALTPDARAKWLALVRAQARDYQQESAALRSDLKPIFFPGASDGLPGASTIRSDEEMKQAIQELFAAGAANDQRISSAFTATSGGAPVTAINTPEFWQAMKRAEALAARIANAQ